LKESIVLTSVSGIIFDFLLNISINAPIGFTAADSLMLMISLYSIFLLYLFYNVYCLSSCAISFRDIEKFKIRSHRFVKFDLVPGEITLYFGLLLGLRFSLITEIGYTYEQFSYIIAIVPIILVYTFFRLWK
jgi:hypothetical protein